METPKFKGARCDGYVDKGNDFSDSIVRKYVHKQVVQKTGDTEDDFILVEKPVCVEEYDIHKQIQEEAVGTDLKSLIAQVMRTGDESILNKKVGAYADITQYPNDSIEAHNQLIKAEEARRKLPKKLRDMPVEELLKLSKEEILEAYGIKPQVEVKNTTEKVVESEEK